MSESTPWVIVGPSPYLGSCLRCGATAQMPKFPMAIALFCEAIDRFATAHEKCEEEA